MADLTDDLEQEGTEQDEVNVLDMSDEDFLNEPIPEDLVAETEEVLDNDKEVDGEVDDTSTDDDEETASDDADTGDQEGGDTSTETDLKATDDDGEAGTTEEEDTETQDTDTSEINYKAEHEKLLGKFRANGKDMQVASVDDAITLMKMGANYNKKMAGLKPNLKLLKMMENNDLLDEGKLSFLIDLDKKDPEAIKKLIKDSGIDPLDVNLKEDTEYKPNTYTVDDKQVELDEVLDDIRETTTFKDTIDIVSNKWDASSRQVLLGEPAIIKVINEHVESGVYEQINSIVESERMLGRLTGLSDLEAYKVVGDTLKANNAFTHQQQTGSKTAKPEQDTGKVEDPKLKSRKKAASSTKSTSHKKVKKEFNPLSLSDEEFEKLSSDKFI